LQTQITTTLLLVLCALIAVPGVAQSTIPAVWPCKTGCVAPTSNQWIIGEIRAFAFGNDSQKLVDSLAQAGWVECRGQDVAVAEFLKLAAVIGPTWGSAEGKYTFYLPDFRGTFLRGWHHGKQGTGDDPYRGDTDVQTRLEPKPDVVPQEGIKGSVNANMQFVRDHVGSVQRDGVGKHTHDIALRGYYQFAANVGGSPNMLVDTPPEANQNQPQNNQETTTPPAPLAQQTHPISAYIAYFIYVGAPATDIENGTVSLDGKAVPSEVSGGCIRAKSTNKKTCDFSTK
jgi:hypothetical protein